MQRNPAQAHQCTDGARRPLPEVRLTVKSGDMAVRDALERTLRALAPLDLDIEERGTVELVLAEALNNIVEHAYDGTVEDGAIRLCCRHARDGLHVTIRDSGRPMPDGRTPVGEAVNVEVDLPDLPEGGFGWFLIKDLAKDVVYRRDGDENHLTFRVAIAT